MAITMQEISKTEYLIMRSQGFSDEDLLGVYGKEFVGNGKKTYCEVHYGVSDWVIGLIMGLNMIFIVILLICVLLTL